MKLFIKVYLLFFLLFIISNFLKDGLKAFAIETGFEGIAAPLVSDEKVIDGEIISYDGVQMSKSKKFSDSNIYGVAASDPSIAIMDLGNRDSMYVVSSGKALVRVSGERGSIEVNDFVTSSDQPGLGVKSEGKGKVLGVALESYNKKEPGFIQVNINPHYEGEQKSQGFTGKNLFLTILLYVFVNRLLFF